MLKAGILVALLSVAISETTEHFMCRSVRNGGFPVGTVNHNRGTQGLPGERGAPGVPGGQGPPGSTESVDYEKIYEIIDKKIHQGLTSIKSEFEELRRDFTKFPIKNESKPQSVDAVEAVTDFPNKDERTPAESTTTFPTKNESKDQSVEAVEAVTDFPSKDETTSVEGIDENSTDSESQLCKGENDLIYDGKCFYVDILKTPSVVRYITYSEAIQRCSSRNSLVAELHSLAHQKAIQDFVRSRLPSPIAFWLGMTYQSSKRNLRFRSGKEVSADQFKWTINFPSGSDDKMAIAIFVRNGGLDDKYEGILNRPASIEINGVICEKPL